MSVLVYTENWNGKFKKLSFELASYASELAEMAGIEPVAVSIGKVEQDELMKLAGYGIKKIISVEGENLDKFDTRTYSRLISDQAKNESATIIVLADNNRGKALAPRISVRLQAAVASGVTGLPEQTEPFRIKKRAFSGNAFATLELKTVVKILTLTQNSFDLREKSVEASIEKQTAENYDTGPGPEIQDVQIQTGKLLLADAEIVVSGGRGMKSADNWGPILELAQLLNGATACSRPVSDEGWRPHEEHTGQTGKVIAPNLYIAIGISGATQHLAGISGSKYIVAINNDKDAPIFDAAQYGIVGDAAKVLPKLVEALKVAGNS
ncbi:MAG: electron transfer flavoprotein subunit alpha/FixB family protein [Bacteroidia bacterium]|nr:MAG: electron transfer flavoprotein subunit alpha/FixB family protein [Bacteroidia bacterium]